MPLRKQKQFTVTNLAIRDADDTKGNPFTFPPGVGSSLNVVPYKGAISRMGFVPPFQTSGASSRVWKIFEFKFQRDGAPEVQLLVFRANGKIYKRCGGGAETEIFPGKTSFSILAKKPSVTSIANRMFVDDGAQFLVWDGWEWCNDGLTAYTVGPTTAFVAGALTGTYNVCFTQVHIRGGVRIHESTRSPVSTVSPAAQNIRVTAPAPFDARATHWSVYISEISGAGNRMRRAATVAITSGTTDISANPSSTSPFAPERNDKPQASGILFQWKNRLGMGDRTNPESFWFSAFEEVKGNLNGGPEESVPGRNGTGTSISDLSNNWRLPDRGEALKAGIWHENFAWLFSDRNGYVVQGEGGLLDSRALRDFFPLKSFPFGAAGIGSLCSTPHGLVIFTPERKLYLWDGGTDVIDIGSDIQAKLDIIPDTELPMVEMCHWTGNSRDWLVVTSGRWQEIYFFDFSRPRESVPGQWFHYLDVSGSFPTSCCVFRPDDQPCLLFGLTNGDVKLLDRECQPTHLDAGFTLGSVYLSTSVQGSTAAQIISYHISPEQDQPFEAKYLILKQRCRQTTGGASNTIPANPTVSYAMDQLFPETTGTTSLTVGSARPDGSKRVWFKPSGGSDGGVRGHTLNITMGWSGVDTESLGDGSGRTKFVNSQLLQFALVWQPLSPQTD